jgi:hypothetical protein
MLDDMSIHRGGDEKRDIMPIKGFHSHCGDKNPLSRWHLHASSGGGRESIPEPIHRTHGPARFQPVGYTAAAQQCKDNYKPLIRGSVRFVFSGGNLLGLAMDTSIRFFLTAFFGVLDTESSSDFCQSLDVGVRRRCFFK